MVNQIIGDMSPEEKKFYHQLLPVNAQLVTEMEQIGSYMRRRQITPKNNMMLEELLGNIERALKRIRKSYTKNELTGSMMTEADKAYGCLDRELYFNALAMNCLETVNELNEIFQGK